MFGKKKSEQPQIPTAEPAVGTSPEALTKTGAAVHIPEDDVHVMPDTYLADAPAPKAKKDFKWLVIGLVIFVILGAIIATVVLFLKKNSQPAELPSVQRPSPTSPATKPSPTSPATSTTTPEVVEPEEKESTPAKRDEQRISDIIGLRQALSLYFNDNSIYPLVLANLAPDYLEEIPKDPSQDTGDYQYNYVVGSDELDYKLIFSIEEAAKFNNVKFKAGQYYVNEQGVFPYKGDDQPPADEPEGKQPLNLTPPTKGLDSDQDGLSDIEENMFGTKSAYKDSDEDGYEDYQELLSFYDPTQPNARLLDSDLVSIYQSQKHSFSLIYPASLAVRTLPPDNSQIIFSTTTGEFFSIVAVDNPLALSTVNWYMNQNPVTNMSEFKNLFIDSLPALQTPDGLVTYLAVGDKVFVITYNIGTANQANFSATYQLLLKSFILIEVEPLPSEPVGQVPTSTPQ